MIIEFLLGFILGGGAIGFVCYKILYRDCLAKIVKAKNEEIDFISKEMEYYKGLSLMLLNDNKEGYENTTSEIDAADWWRE